MNKQETMKEMQKQIEELSKNLEVLKNSEEKIEFLREGYEVSSTGGISYVPDRDYMNNTNDRALTFATEAIAQKVDKITQQSYKIAQYVFQKEPDYVPDWESGHQVNCQIYYSNMLGKYIFESYASVETKGVIYMPKEVAIQLIEDLNNGNYSID